MWNRLRRAREILWAEAGTALSLSCRVGTYVFLMFAASCLFCVVLYLVEGVPIFSDPRPLMAWRATFVFLVPALILYLAGVWLRAGEPVPGKK